MPRNIQKGIINQALMRMKLYNNQIAPFYLMYFDFVLKNEAIKQGKGTAIKNIPPFDVLKQFLIPIPSLNEKKRIISSLEEIENKIDEVKNNKDEIFDLIKQTKSKVLDLAIRGKLVLHDSNDEPASVLLKKIKIEQKKIGKKAAEVSDISHYPFVVPDSWVWCQGEDCLISMESKKPKGDTFGYIDIDAIDNKSHSISSSKKIRVCDAPSRASRKVHIGDVLFSMVRPYLENIAYVDKKYSECIASTGFFVCTPNNNILQPKYLFFLMISSYVINGLNNFMKGDNSPSINNENITSFLYPIPPLCEQTRIVKQIETIFNQLDAIEQSIKA
ncbi:Type I restriction enzyme EcoKI specificity protein [Bacteroidales bacterium Barb4]|nr:Type I restriction enzyme EcoKI specificity protein [Bacteroidales bacterium Barb4]